LSRQNRIIGAGTPTRRAAPWSSFLMGVPFFNRVSRAL